MGRRQTGFNGLTEEQLSEIEQKAKAGTLEQPVNRHKRKTENSYQRTRPDVAERNLARLQNQAPAELNAAYIQHGMTLLRSPSVNLHSYQEVHDRVEWYFRQCEHDGIKPNRPGLELCLHTTVSTISDMRHGVKAYAEDAAVTEFIKDVLKLMETYTFMAMQDGSINALVAFFTLKNHYGYTDKTEVTIKATDPLGELPDGKAVAERISADVVDVDYIDAENG